MRFAREVTEHLGVKMVKPRSPLSRREVMIEVPNVRGGMLHHPSICTPPNENLMELILLTRCAPTRLSGRITAVIPYSLLSPGSQSCAARADQRQGRRRPDHDAVNRVLT